MAKKNETSRWYHTIGHGFLIGIGVGSAALLGQALYHAASLMYRKRSTALESETSSGTASGQLSGSSSSSTASASELAGLIRREGS